jgi:alpha-mannosidase
MGLGRRLLVGQVPAAGCPPDELCADSSCRLWDEARLSEETSRWNEPPQTQLMEGSPAAQAKSFSFVGVSGGGVEIPTLLVEDRSVWVRLFNGEGDASERTVSFGFEPSRVELIELDGRLVRRLAMRRANGRFAVSLAMPRFGIRTLRCELAKPVKA